MWSFDARDMDRVMDRQQSGRSANTHNTLRAAGSQELPLMRGGRSGVSGLTSSGVPDDDEEEWIERSDPSGKRYYEHSRTRRATWTDHRIKEDNSVEGSVSSQGSGMGSGGGGGSGSRRGSAINQSRRGSAMAVSLSGVQEDQESRSQAPSFAWNENPMRDEEGGEGGERDAAGLTRTRSNTYGSSNVPVLSKKGIEEAKAREKAAAGGGGKGGDGKSLPPPPPPPPVGWSRAMDPQGREYFWHNETGKTSWTLENCKL